jgi:hypothetical protein
MDINPFQMLGAFVAACLVLLIARIKGDRPIPKRFSMGALIIAVAVLAGVLTLAGHALRK